MPNNDNNKIYVLTAIDLSAHLVLTIILALVFLKISGRVSWAIAAAVGGILIDLDHLIDNCLHFGLKFRVKDFFGHKYLASGKTYLFFHSWELVAVLGLFSLVVPILIPVSCGMMLHLLTDLTISRKTGPLALSLVYRWRKKFLFKEIERGR